MRMLLRASTYRFDELDGETEIAAAPDTPGREHWSWELRLMAAATTATSVHRGRPTTSEELTSLRRSDGSTAVVVLRGDLDFVEPSLRQEPVGSGIHLARKPGELVVLVAAGGSVLVAGIHQLGELDALVVEGDELPAFSVTPLPDKLGAQREEGRAVIAVARLASRTGEHLRWVP